MKLLSRYYRVNIITTIVVLILSGLYYYFAIRYLLIGQLDDDLNVDEQEIIYHVRKNGTVPDPYISKVDHVASA